MVDSQQSGQSVRLIVRAKPVLLVKRRVQDDIVHVEEQVREKRCKIHDVSFWQGADSLLGNLGHGTIVVLLGAPNTNGVSDPGLVNERKEMGTG